MLPDSPDVAPVAGELVPALGEGTIWIDMSHAQPGAHARAGRRGRGARARRARRAGLGRRQGRARGDAVDHGAAARRRRSSAARPLFEVLGKTIVHVGDAGAGQVVKACNQVLVAMAMQGMAEALVLGAKAGVDPEHDRRRAERRARPLRRARGARQAGAAGDFEPGFRAGCTART